MKYMFRLLIVMAFFTIGKADAQKKRPDHLRVSKKEAVQMRERFGKDEGFKISREDLEALVQGNRAENDSFIFYLVKLGTEEDGVRYAKKARNANWNTISRVKPTSVLVGLIPGNSVTGHINPKLAAPKVTLFDLAVVCPPPPNCNCEIED